MMIVIKGKFVIGIRKQVDINVLTLASELCACPHM